MNPTKTGDVEVDRNVYHYKQTNGVIAVYSWYIHVHRQKNYEVK